MVFEDVVGIYLAAKDHRSKQRDLYSLKRLQPHFGGRDLSRLKRADVREYLSLRRADGVSESTVQRELRFFSAAINFVRLEHDRGDLPNPVVRLGLGVASTRVRWITRAEAESLVASASEFARRPHLPNFIRLALHTGCRKNELLRLEWANVDLRRRILQLEPEKTKNGKRRVIPLNDEALQALIHQREWALRHVPRSRWVFAVPSGARLTTIQKGFQSACARAGIDNFRVHDLRHTFASWLVMAGVSLYVVKDLLGHSSVVVTERYAHLAPHVGRSAVQLLLAASQT
ncbi:tyrosine-type recombinase/integrase [Paraburkholderia rhizosphaerae]|uniref:Site-specific recombinase XerD n=1 Tax=Paraburkholderia rhizosphaerae TaxID=480658 RepID=A0A4R8LN84_9BURK|nr:site-specific integrase [Paraburkholderia rhizosphaerae]TDY47711.1 site-specific recombinase XerD [Paraburkholderia rhizosphaerae]